MTFKMKNGISNCSCFFYWKRWFLKLFHQLYFSLNYFHQWDAGISYPYANRCFQFQKTQPGYLSFHTSNEEEDSFFICWHLSSVEILEFCHGLEWSWNFSISTPLLHCLFLIVSWGKTLWESPVSWLHKDKLWVLSLSLLRIPFVSYQLTRCMFCLVSNSTRA